MGRKLGNALIIYGIINAFVCLFLGPFIAIGGLIWLVIFIALGKWQRDKDKHKEELRRMEQDARLNNDRLNQSRNITIVANMIEDVKPQLTTNEIKYDALADMVNKILDEREAKEKGSIRYLKD